MHDFWMIALYGAVVLGALVFVHELGHFLVAKWLGVRVLSFSIGMGPRLFGFQKGGTDYRISILPLGGFVRMAGDSPDANDRQGRSDEFLEKPWWARALITAAGPFANLVLAFLINVSVYLIGVRTPDFPSTVGHVAPASTVERVGLREWDKIETLDGRPARTMRQLANAVDHVEGDKKGAPTVSLRLPWSRYRSDCSPDGCSGASASAPHLSPLPMRPSSTDARPATLRVT